MYLPLTFLLQGVVQRNLLWFIFLTTVAVLGCIVPCPWCNVVTRTMAGCVSSVPMGNQDIQVPVQHITGAIPWRDGFSSKAYYVLCFASPITPTCHCGSSGPCAFRDRIDLSNYPGACTVFSGM
eukprot:scpid108059/ scgid21273/ 